MLLTIYLKIDHLNFIFIIYFYLFIIIIYIILYFPHLPPHGFCKP